MLEILGETTLIHCIESKEGHFFEENAVLNLKTAPMGYHKQFESINIIQPSELDISRDLKEKFKDRGIKFKKQIIKSNQKNNSTNYSLIPEVCHHFSKNIKSEYMMWQDLDVYFKKDFKLEIKDMQDKILTNIVRVKDPVYLDNKEHLKKLKNNIIDQDEKLFDYYYQTFFKKRLFNEYGVDKIDHYINTWTIIGRTKNRFWKDWVELTRKINVIISEDYRVFIDLGLEFISEELAASILYERDAGLMDDLPSNLLLGVDKYIGGYNVAVHYESFLNIKDREVYDKVRELGLMKSLVNESPKRTIDYMRIMMEAE